MILNSYQINLNYVFAIVRYTQCIVMCSLFFKIMSNSVKCNYIIIEIFLKMNSNHNENSMEMFSISYYCDSLPRFQTLTFPVQKYRDYISN